MEAQHQKYFARKLSELMAKNGITQVVLAKKLNIKQPAISQFLNEKAYPSTMTLIRLSEIFRVTLYELTNLETLKNIEVAAKKRPELTPDQEKLLALYNELPDDDWRKKAIDELLLKSKD